MPYPFVVMIKRGKCIDGQQSSKSEPVLLDDYFRTLSPEISTDEERFSRILNPLWSSADDFYLLKARQHGKDFSAIAGELERNFTMVQLRYHHLRTLDDITELLERYGLSDMRYCQSLPEDYRLPSTL